jgi:hypothetical protein
MAPGRSLPKAHSKKYSRAGFTLARSASQRAYGLFIQQNVEDGDISHFQAHPGYRQVALIRN